MGRQYVARVPPKRGFIPAQIGQLIRPLSLGETVAPGWILRRARISDDGLRIHYTLSPPEVEVVVAERDDQVKALKRTTKFNLYHQSTSEQQLGRDAVEALRAIIRLIARNEADDVTDVPSRPADPSSRAETGDREAGAQCILYLVPGHVSDEGDLGMRGWRALASAQVIFVEQDKEATTAALLERHGVDTSGKQILPVPHAPVQLAQTVTKFREAVERGADTCLFGVDDGIPAFCDPGREIVLEAARLSDRVRVKTLGGPSALAAVLMRAETPIEAFTFAGILQGDPHVECIAQLLVGAGATGLPVVFFGMGVHLRSLLPALLARMPGWRGRMSLYGDLTSNRETVWHIELPVDTDLPAFADGLRVIGIITSAAGCER